MWRACLGKHHASPAEEPAEVCYFVDRIVTHHSYSYPQDYDISNDIALVHLAQKAYTTREISPICLPEDDKVLPEGTRCYVTGWGDARGEVFSMVSRPLTQAALPLVSLETCRQPQYWWDGVWSSMICAGYESPDEFKSACQGDSGGPLVCRPEGGISTWELHGVVTFGPRSCAKDSKPSVFTRVSAFSRWIRGEIERFAHERSSLAN
ncbi:chymotrypsin-like protease CTRL-1 [Scleropages formosus]|nr:chymotrypsin-like protease CTRL-1 [Scleropages formosus]